MTFLREPIFEVSHVFQGVPATRCAAGGQESSARGRLSRTRRSGAGARDRPLNACEAEHLRYALELVGAGCAAIITNTPHNTDEACAIVRNLISLVEGQHVEFVAALFKSIWGAEPGRLPFFDRPSFYSEILCCWRPRWIPGTKKSPMHAYTWYVWRKQLRSGPSLKVRVGRQETIAAPSREHADLIPSAREPTDFSVTQSMGAAAD
jgi:hypothetical protein